MLRIGMLKVDPLGLEPRLFWTKTRRVASYTMGQSYRRFPNGRAKVVIFKKNKEGGAEINLNLFIEIN